MLLDSTIVISASVGIRCGQRVSNIRAGVGVAYISKKEVTSRIFAETSNGAGLTESRFIRRRDMFRISENAPSSDCKFSPEGLDTHHLQSCLDVQRRE